MFGKYERGEIILSLEIANKIADAPDLSLDYLVGDGDLKVLDKKVLQRLLDIAKLPSDDKIHIFYTIENLIKAVKLKAI